MAKKTQKISQAAKSQRLAGFRDFFAEDLQLRENVISVFKKVFEKYGYEPLETPALEPAEIFESQVGEEAQKLFYRFQDQGGRDVILKYEVMISMCRAVAENLNQITLPYKRYQIQTVWRAEKPQKGRFREFTQCDADTIGSPSLIADAEFIQMGIEILKKLGFKKFRANLNNRKLLNGIIRAAGADPKDFIPICLSIDKLPKLGPAGVKKELLQVRKISPAVATKILAFVTLSGSNDELLKKFREKLKKNSLAQEGLNEIEEILNYLKNSQISQDYYQFAPFIARGLAYYTGPIWEFEILDGKVGSVAGCGRYDETFTRLAGKKIPATGGSFGLERIIEILKDRKMVKLKAPPTQVLVTYLDPKTLSQSLYVANFLRDNKIAALLYPHPDSLQKQLKFADLKKIKFTVILGPEEVKKEALKVKIMTSREQKEIPLKDLYGLVNFVKIAA